MSDFPDVVGAFSDLDKTVVNWEGENFYRACGVFVADHSDGGQSSCVKRIGHPSNIHEDYDGVVRRSDEDVATDGFESVEKLVGINIGDRREDIYPDKADGAAMKGTTNVFNQQTIEEYGTTAVRRQLAYERAKELVDSALESRGWSLEDFKISPGGFTLGYSTVNTKLDQYLGHIEALADWLLGNAD